MTAQNSKDITIPGVVKLDKGQGGLPRVLVTSPLADAEIYLNGAHVTRYQPRGAQPVLFMSAGSQFTAGKPIRGGVPVIFPWFGPREGHPESPAHGLVRTMEWQPASARQLPDGAVEVTLTVTSNDGTRAQWPHDFSLRFIVTVGKQLDMVLEVQNSGKEPFRFEEALHTYFAVKDVRNVSVTGLAGAEYFDKVDGFKRKRQGDEPIRITGETDRVYINTSTTCVIDDPGLSRKIIVEKERSDSTVVWNPWIAKSKALPDFGDDEWPDMICVETCNAVENAVNLRAGAAHRMRQTVRLD